MRPKYQSLVRGYVFFLLYLGLQIACGDGVVDSALESEHASNTITNWLCETVDLVLLSEEQTPDPDPTSIDPVVSQAIDEYLKTRNVVEIVSPAEPWNLGRCASEFQPEAIQEFTDTLTPRGIPVTEDVMFWFKSRARAELVKQLTYGVFQQYGDARVASRPETQDLFEPPTEESTRNLKIGTAVYQGGRELSNIYNMFRTLFFYGCGSRRSLEVAHFLQELPAAMDESLKVGKLKVAEWAFFSSDLEMLLADPLVRQYLRALPKLLQAAIAGESEFDLWQFTLSYTDDKQEAIRWLAVLFQDFNGVLGIGYAANRDLADEETLRALDQSMALLKQNPGTKTLRLLPEGVDLPNASRSYHFYATAYIVHKLSLKATDEMSKSAAILAPIFFNLEYEYLWIDIREMLICIPFQFLGLHRQLDRVRNYEDIVDIYLGLSGALFSGELSIPSFEWVLSQITSDPIRFGQNLMEGEIEGWSASFSFDTP